MVTSREHRRRSRAANQLREGFRVPTPAELACADPDEPCLLSTNYASDPPLEPVVSHTYELGLRGALAPNVKWSIAWYRNNLDNEVLFVNAGGTSSLGFFQNVPHTRRQGLEIGLSGTWNRLRWFANYSYIDATYQTDTTLLSAVGPVPVQSGDCIPLVPNHMAKAGFDYEVLKDWYVGADLQYGGSQYLQGDYNNQYPEKVSDYLVLNLNTRYQLTKQVQIYGEVRNLTDKRYKTYSLINRNAFSDPIGQPTTFYSPGAPIGGWVGIRLTFL
jgi:iron complex outermembrane receptor protein